MKNPVIIFLVTVLLLANACKPKDKSLIIKFEGSSFEQKWAISDLNPDFPSDWSGYGFLTFDMNASSTQRFFINLYDKEGMRRLRVLPFQGAWVRASIPLANFQKRNVVGQDMAAIGQKGMPGYGLGFTGSVGFIKNIDSLGILMENPMGSPVLEVRNMRLTMNPEDSILSPVPLVDEFGQWIPDEWPGKARNIEDLRAAWNEEDKALQTNRFNVSKYGGFLETKSRASGYFRVEKIDGKWWFIDPEGHYFISAGSTGINPGGSFARTEGREMELINVILVGEDTPMKAALQKFLSGGDTPERRRQFVYDTYTIFIKMVNGAIKKYDPNHLNLGLRFGGHPPEDLVMASASVGFDVFSLNIYNYSAESVLLKRIDEMTGLPIIIGEFHFGTAERGLSPGLRQTISQEERGVAYRYYVENAVAHPSLIGTHWFQWWDQPSTGRGDGENYNIGFIDVTDRPYKELVDAARETHSRLLEIHSGKIPPVSRQAVTQ